MASSKEVSPNKHDIQVMSYFLYARSRHGDLSAPNFLFVPKFPFSVPKCGWPGYVPNFLA